MARQIIMPALSPTMEEGALIAWRVAEGERFSAGDVLCEVETDKATMEVEAEEDGVLGAILAPAGTEGIKVRAPIAVMLAEGEDASEAARAGAAPVAAAAAAAWAAPRPPEWPEAAPMKKQTLREALRDAMAAEMRADGDVFLMGEEVAANQGAYHVSEGLLEEFGAKRVIDTPIAEYGFTGLACGAAFAGLRPIVEFMTFNFALQAIDHIVNTAARARYMSGGAMACPIVFRGPNGPAARVGAQHSGDFAALYAQIPGLKVVQPYAPADAKGLLRAAIRDPNPVVFLESEMLYGKSADVPQADYETPLGKARIWRSGTDVTLVSFGAAMQHALKAADALAREGVSAEVIDLRCLRPMDTEAVIRSVRKTGRCVTVEEGTPVCSVGAEISALLMREAFDWLDAPVLTCTGRDVPMPYAASLEALAQVNAAQVIDACRSVCNR